MFSGPAASRRENADKGPPRARLIQASAPEDCRMRPAALAANAAIPRHHSVPLKMKIPLRSKNASVLCGSHRARGDVEQETRQDKEPEVVNAEHDGVPSISYFGPAAGKGGAVSSGRHKIPALNCCGEAVGCQFRRFVLL